MKQLGPEVPIIRHHHEWFNGSGYPDRLEGESIPLGARILHVADAFEAMTSPRPYRPKPLTAEQALREIRKYTGVQFDPNIVEAFVRTHYVEGVADPGRPELPRQIPTLAVAAAAAQGGDSGGALDAPRTNPTGRSIRERIRCLLQDSGPHRRFRESGTGPPQCRESGCSAKCRCLAFERIPEEAH